MGRDADYPDTVAVFSEQQAPGLTSQPSFLHGDIVVSVDTRDSVGHATVGGFYQATWSVFADQTTGRNSFQRYEADASHYIPLGSDNWILALHGAAALSSTTAGHDVPFYLMPNLGGRNSRGFTDYRFHDRNMQAYTIESRWRVFSHLDAAAFVDAGSVSPTIRQLRFSDLKPFARQLISRSCEFQNQDTSRGAQRARPVPRRARSYFRRLSSTLTLRLVSFQDRDVVFAVTVQIALPPTDTGSPPTVKVFPRQTFRHRCRGIR